MVSTAVATRNGQTAVAAPIPEVLEGAEGFSSSDLKIPVLKIVQGTSKMEESDAHLGQFHNSITGEFKVGIEVVILSSKHSRALFRRMEEADADKPECLSRDCITGTTHGSCSRCEFNAQQDRTLWDADPETGLAPKRCNLGYSLMLWLLEDGLPAIFTAQKSNVNPIKIVNTILVGRKVPLFGAAFTFTSVRKIDGAKKWYELSARVARWHTAEETAGYRDLAHTLKGSQYEVVDEEPAAPQPPDDFAPPYAASDPQPDF